ncbi:MAG: hypothetical protein HC900_00160 [Methylacidiphilales bacterium]|nr:hypothetical protein [Candidatus Methylacidiphilales bacterium]
MPELERLRREVSLVAQASAMGVKLMRDGGEYVARCPFHSEDTASFTIFRGDDGVERFHCFGCGAHGDATDFVAQIKGVDTREAIRILRGQSSSLPNRSPRHLAYKVDPYAGITPVTPTAVLLRVGAPVRLYNPKRKGSPMEWGEFVPSHVFPYRDAAGDLTGYVLRRSFPDSGKETPMVMRVRLPGGGECWARFPFPKPRPLYGLPRLGGGGQVMVVEGEKCADRYFKVTGRAAVTWAGGTQGVKHADWSPLAGMDVLMWPDHDNPGRTTMDEIGCILASLGARFRVVDIFGV